MQQIALILTCLGIGVVPRVTGRLPDTAANVLGGWVINVALPAAAISSVHGLTLHPDWWLAASTPWIGVALGHRRDLSPLPCAGVVAATRRRAGARWRVG